MIQQRQNLFIYRETSTPWFDRTAAAISFHEIFAPKIKDGAPMDPLIMSFGVLPDFRKVQPVIHSTNLEAEKDYAGLLVLTPHLQEYFADRIVFSTSAQQKKLVSLRDLTEADLSAGIMGMQFSEGPPNKLDQEQLADAALIFQGRYLGDGELMLAGRSAHFHLGEALRAESPLLAGLVENGSRQRAMRK